MTEHSNTTDAAPLVSREQHHDEVVLAASGPDNTAAIVTVDRGTPGCVLVTLRRARVDERPEGRSLTPLSAPIALPLSDTGGHLAVLIAVLQEALLEVEEAGVPAAHAAR